MPVIGEEDAKAIVSAILAMRGADKKKHKEALEQGALRLPVNKLSMQGVIHTWRQARGKGDVWNGSHNATTIAEGHDAESKVRLQQFNASSMQRGRHCNQLEMQM